MRKMLLARWIVFLISFHGLLAQSVVFVSPSTKGLLTMSCAGVSLDSFEQLQYLSTARYLAERLCQRSEVDGGVGIWKGQAENSGMIDGCANDKARELGALLAKYYHQKQALVFDRNPNGNSSLVSFRVTQPLGVISIRMVQAKVEAATILPHMHDNLMLIVVSDEDERARSMTLYTSLHGRDLHEEPGTIELIGHEDRTKARAIFSAIINEGPADVRQLGNDMYSEQFDSGLKVAQEAAPAH